MYPADDFPGLEDRALAELRILEGVRRLALEAQGRDLVLVSHGEISHIFLAKLRGEKTRTGRSALKNAAISTLEFEEASGFCLEFYNKSAAELTDILESM